MTLAEWAARKQAEYLDDPVYIATGLELDVIM